MVIVTRNRRSFPRKIIMSSEWSPTQQQQQHTRVFLCDARETCAAYVNYLQEYVTGNFRNTMCLYSKEKKFCWCANNHFNCDRCTPSPAHDRGGDRPIFCSSLVKQSREMSLYATQQRIVELYNDTESKYLLSIEVTISNYTANYCDAKIVLSYAAAPAAAAAEAAEQANLIFEEISRVEVSNLTSFRLTPLLLAKKFKSILAVIIRNEIGGGGGGGDL